MVTVVTPPSPVYRVASVPAGHRYVEHLNPSDAAAAGRVYRLPDPDRPWWPPRMLEPAWVSAHLSEFDLMHVHFGYDAVEPSRLTRVADLLDEAGKPLVATVHDLRNPQHHARAAHEAQLAVLLARASEVITLTPGAAREIARRSGRRATVVPHPHIVDLGDLATEPVPPPVTTPTVGLHLKSLRANVDPAIAWAAAGGVARVAGAKLRLDIHADVLAPSHPRHVPTLAARLARLAREPHVDLVVGERMSDDALHAYVPSLSASVLPYRWGTHSGWLELCRDLGTAVVAPDCGYYAQQGPTFGFACGESRGLDADSCAGAVEAALREGRPLPLGRGERERQRAEIAKAHAEVYARALGRARN